MPLHIGLLTLGMGEVIFMNKLQALWDFLNGKKTAIGIVSTAAVTAAEQVGWLPQGSTTFWILFLGAIGITVVGAAHKEEKARAAYKAGVESCKDTPGQTGSS